MQCDVFLNELIEIESQGLGAPSDFADPAGRADDLKGDFQGGAGSGGINDSVAAKVVPLHGPRVGIADDHLAAIAFGDFETVRVLLKSHDGNLCSAEAGHGGT